MLGPRLWGPRSLSVKLWAGRSLSEKKEVFRYSSFPKRPRVPHVFNHHGLAVVATVGGGCWVVFGRNW